MTVQSDIQQAPITLVAAARALLDCYSAGVIAIPPAVPWFQRLEIEREFRVDRQILTGVGAMDCAVMALAAVACFRRGLETGVLLVACDDAAPRIKATIASIAAELDRTEATDGPLASLWFDPPVELQPVG